MLTKSEIARANGLANKHQTTIVVVRDYCLPEKPLVYMRQESYEDSEFEAQDVEYVANPL